MFQNPVEVSTPGNSYKLEFQVIIKAFKKLTFSRHGQGLKLGLRAQVRVSKRIQIRVSSDD